jgi:hypothetical protein
LYVLGYSASVFGNSVSMLIAALGLLGHSNGYQATVAIARNRKTIFVHNGRAMMDSLMHVLAVPYCPEEESGQVVILWIKRDTTHYGPQR